MANACCHAAPFYMAPGFSAQLRFQKLSVATSHGVPAFSTEAMRQGKPSFFISTGIQGHACARQVVRSPLRMKLEAPGVDPATSIGFKSDGWQRAQWKEGSLPNGLPVRYVGGKEELLFLYDEIFSDQLYLKEATLGPGDVVLDVGANIGLFSLFAALRCPGGQVVACEPIPPIFNALHWNIASLQKGKGPQETAQITCLNVGLSSGDQSEADFTFYEKSPGWSSMAPNEDEMRSAMQVFLDKLLQAPPTARVTPLRVVGQVLRSTAPKWLFGKLASAYIEGMMEDKVTFTCPLKTVSEVIHEMKLSKVDLLKVDVERAELDVLLGIELSDWSKIRQVAIEVHDLHGRLKKVIELLEYMGFKVTYFESRGMEGTGLHMVYGKRADDWRFS